MTTETVLRKSIVRYGQSMFERGLTFGSSGNISARLDDGWLMTPTNVALDRLDPARLSKLDDNGKLLSGDAPTKECFLHIAMYRAAAEPAARWCICIRRTRSRCPASPMSIRRTCCRRSPPTTSCASACLPLVPFYPPGDPTWPRRWRKLAGKHHAVLLANHGPVVAGTSLDAAVNAIEELEETAQAVPAAAPGEDPLADAGAGGGYQKTLSAGVGAAGYLAGYRFRSMDPMPSEERVPAPLDVRRAGNPGDEPHVQRAKVAGRPCKAFCLMRIRTYFQALPKPGWKSSIHNVQHRDPFGLRPIGAVLI